MFNLLKRQLLIYTLMLSKTHEITGYSSNMQQIQYKQLPAEVHDVLKRIATDGPFFHQQDGTVFRNRENKLPAQDDFTYYREYTVLTPNTHDRGARRIIIGRHGEKYYTQDHYRTFMEIIECTP